MRKFFFIIIFSILIYSRFVGLSWGLPYPMHPDERNMATAIQGLNCRVQDSRFELRSCFNPHFFAYGQFPLYLGYLLVQIYHFIMGKVGLPIAFEEAVMSLRLISALATVINVIIVIKIIKTVRKLRKNDYFIFLPIVIFSPYFIQFSHFGTTEALLMLFYSLIIYYSVQLIEAKLLLGIVFILGLFCGLAIATKVSAVIFVLLPFITLMSNISTSSRSAGLCGASKSKKQKILIFLRQASNITRYLFLLLLLTAFFAIIFSPHNLISFYEFLGSLNYESAVALGKTKVFYTRQFEYTPPILWPAIKIFPYPLGWPQYILAILGLFLLSWRKKQINLLRLAFLIYFIANVFFYAKWTRFMTPILPIMSIFSGLVLFNIHKKLTSFNGRKLKIKNEKLKMIIENLKYFNFSLCILYFIFYILFLIPGIAYLSIYQNQDVRLVASKWIYENIPEDSYILYETANVVDIPIDSESSKVHKVYKGVSFNFYDIDSNPLLQEEFYHHLEKADYIFVPSRRAFANHTCDSKLKIKSEKLKVTIINLKFWEKKKCQYLKNKYPLLNDYYEKLFSGRLGFRKVAEFNSYPKIALFGKTLIEFPDENAEETWTVFDHPVIRIYKKF